MGNLPKTPELQASFLEFVMDAKAALTGSDRKAILNSCDYGESVAVETYEKVLMQHLEELTFDQKLLVKAQHNLNND